jgi:H+/Cl- antiporter ClcA
MHPPPDNDERHHSHAQPDILAALRGELTNSRAWVARVVVLAFAALAGAVVVAFTWLSEEALDAFMQLRAAHPWLPFVWTPALLALLAWITVRFVPGASGSGIPQVMAALSHAVHDNERSRFVSLRIAVSKVLLTAGALLGGLAVGREGPAVQIAAGVMRHARKYLPSGAISEHSLLVAGGAAGIAAAFNTPLAGVMFAIEELTRKIEQRSSGLVVAAIVLAGVIAVSARGNSTYFGVIRVPPLHADFIVPGIAVVLVCGLLGGFFSRLLHACLAGRHMDRFSRLRARHPVRFAAACGLAIAVVGWASEGSSFGSGYSKTRELLEGHLDMPVLYVTLRIVATWLAMWSGVPGGLFAPTLAIGAGLGNDMALFTGLYAESPALIALGMAGFLVAVTQAPLTAFIIVMEMVDGHQMVLSLMAAALGASLVARWVARPLYAALAASQVAALAAARPPAHPSPDTPAGR